MHDRLRPRELPDVAAELAAWMRKPGYDAKLTEIYTHWVGMKTDPGLAARAADYTIDALGREDRDLYWVREDMGTLIATAAADLPGFVMAAADAPSSIGLAWFEQPLTVMMYEGRPPQLVRAIVWLSVAFENRRDATATFVSIWSLPEEYPDEGPVSIDHTQYPPLICVAGEFLGHGVEWKREVEGPLLWPALVLTFFRLVKESYVAEDDEPIERAARRRARRSNVELPDSVRIVTLRRRQDHNEIGDGRDVEWSHRWIVRGHWRNQWYPSEQRHAPKWIPPHVKGPDDKPLVPKTTVNVLRR